MKKILFSILAVIMGGAMLMTPVFADASKDNCVETSLFGEVCDDSHGSSVLKILDLVVDIMTVGIGILGVIGITIVGSGVVVRGLGVAAAGQSDHRGQHQNAKNNRQNLFHCGILLNKS